jgi:Tfp pilus assembly protein PilP
MESVMRLLLASLLALTPSVSFACVMYVDEELERAMAQVDNAKKEQPAVPAAAQVPAVPVAPAVEAAPVEPPVPADLTIIPEAQNPPPASAPPTTAPPAEPKS